MLAASWTVVARAVRKLSGSRRRSRRSLIKQVRSVMRDAERLLIRHMATQPPLQYPPPHAAPAGAPGGLHSGRGRHLGDIDTGLLVISLHLLRQSVERHKVSSRDLP